MTKLEEMSLKSIIPSSIANDSTVQNIISAVDDKLKELSLQQKLVLLLPRLDSLSEALVDELAWQFHVDFYDSKASLSVKRELVRKAIAWHRIKGTPKAVEEVVTAAFQGAKVSEWWDYGAEPYHFRLEGIQEPITDVAVINKVAEAIERTKNTRSWCDGIGFARACTCSMRIVAFNGVHITFDIKPKAFTMPDIKADYIFKSAQSLHRSVNIK